MRFTATGTTPSFRLAKIEYFILTRFLNETLTGMCAVEVCTWFRCQQRSIERC